MKKKLSMFFTLLIVGCSIFYYIIIRYNCFETAPIFVYGLMWMPALAGIITKLITDHTIRGIGWRPCSIKNMLISYFLPIIACIIVYGIAWVTGIGTYKSIMSFGQLIMYAVIGIFISCITAVGEEIGWRGFLLTELRKSFNYPMICLIGGLVWFAYHVPIMWFSTYNNGNIVVSTICFFFMVMGMASIANYLCIKTNSFWPGVILHASHNLFVQNVFDRSTENGPYTQLLTSEFGVGLAVMYGCIAIYLICTFIKNRKTKVVNLK